ncbi:glycosyltransferase family 2 protein [Sinomonas sp.]|uniref:glycosyltransferase family 2 protein n=1 Tax=Sinomonas sp. TaxID=1914986 RepID=UPI002FE3BB5E
MSIAAVVVSFNRLGFLRECLSALKGQTRKPDEIIVVDNGSTDGSAEYVREEHPDVVLFETGANLGGAGGFAWGVELAIARGHQAAWLMDDDACPELDALAPLAELFATMNPKPSFLASLVTAGRDTFNRRNPPVISQDAGQQVAAHEFDAIAIEAATFVGVLINLELAKTTHLPFSDFFIWIDDSEYTHRLSQMAPAMVVPASQVNHPDVAAKAKDLGPRVFYHIRNNLWFIRERKALPATKLVALGNLLHQTVYYGLNSTDKRQWAVAVAKGYAQGCARRPRRIYPGELLATLPDEVRVKLVDRTPSPDKR